MGLFDILLFGVIGWFFYKKFIKKEDMNFFKNQNNKSESDIAGLTQTQINWRKMKQEEKRLREGVEGEADLSRFNLTSDEEAKLRRIEYIQKHLEPISMSGWLMFTPDRRLLTSYFINMFIGFVFGIGIPMFVGFSIMPGVLLSYLLIMDFGLYMKQLGLQATAWNPEYIKRFGED